MLLTVSGYSVITTYTARQALSAAERLKPEVAFLDIGLPDLNGYELATAIRAKPWGANIVLIAITGYGTAAEKQRAIDAGFNYHFTKPVSYTNLEQLLESIH